jgi:uncharacterized protein YndB with AHSA1/START domain
MTHKIEKTIIIEALPFAVWDALTNPEVMKQWMGEAELEIKIITDWQIGTPIVIKGFHHVRFENKGTILRFEPNKVLEYNFLSSLSRLPDTHENYTIVQFRLMALDNQTSLTLTVNNFPTEAIFKHVDFYWRTTLDIMKKVIEKIIL